MVIECHAKMYYTVEFDQVILSDSAMRYDPKYGLEFLSLSLLHQRL